MACPQRVREAVKKLSAAEQSSVANSQGTTTSHGGRPRYGSRKRFAQFVWNKLRNTTVTDDGTIGATTVDTGDEQQNEESAGGYSDDVELENLIRGSEVVCPEDRHLVSDTTLIAMAQVSVGNFHSD